MGRPENRLAARHLPSFLHGQGDQGAVLREVMDEVAAVGFDRIEQGRLVEPVAGPDVSLGFDEQPKRVQVAQARGVYDRRPPIGVFSIHFGTMV